MRKMTASAALLFTALAASANAQSPADETRTAAETGAALTNACTKLVDKATNTYDNDRVISCLKAIKGETVALADDVSRHFVPGADGYRQAPFVAGIASVQFYKDCAAIRKPYSPETPQDAILIITGRAATCLDTIHDAGHLRKITIPFDAARHGAIALTSNCVRSLVDADARAWCADASKTGKRHRDYKPLPAIP